MTFIATEPTTASAINCSFELLVAAPFSKVEEFDSSCEHWTQYVERLGHFFDVNDIKGADKKQAIFLSMVGLSTEP